MVKKKKVVAKTKKKTLGPSKKQAVKKLARKSPKKVAAVKKKAVPKPAVKKMIKPPAKTLVARKPAAVTSSSVRASAQEEMMPHKVAAAAPFVPREMDLDDEGVAQEELDMESDLNEDVQEELNLDDGDGEDNFLEKSEEFLDDGDDYRNN